MRLRSTTIMLLLLAELPLAGCTKTSDGTVEVAGFRQMTALPKLPTFSALSPLLAPMRRRPASRLPPVSAFPPPPPVATSVSPAPAQARRPARAARPAPSRPTRSARRAAAAPISVVAPVESAAPTQAVAPVASAAKPNRPAAPKVIVCKEPVVQGGRYTVTCD